MMPDEQEDSFYYRKIARRFLESRGAPFFLSAKDLDLISSWEKTGLPLPVVLEGIDRAFESLRMRPGKADKILSLSFCSGQVMKAFERYRERRVGAGRKPVVRQDKRRRVEMEIERFLGQLPCQFPTLKNIFLEARQELSDPGFRDDSMEDLDEKVDAELLARAGEADRNEVQREILAAGGRLAGNELARVRDIKVVKRLREKHKIPYLSLFYY